MRVSYDLLGLPFETYKQWLATGAHLPSVKIGRALKVEFFFFFFFL